VKLHDRRSRLSEALFEIKPTRFDGTEAERHDLRIITTSRKRGALQRSVLTLRMGRAGSLCSNGMSTPIRCTRVACCARAASGQAAAVPPSKVMFHGLPSFAIKASSIENIDGYGARAPARPSPLMAARPAMMRPRACGEGTFLQGLFR